MLFFIALRVTINEQKLYVFRLYDVILKKLYNGMIPFMCIVQSDRRNQVY